MFHPVSSPLDWQYHDINPSIYLSIYFSLVLSIYVYVCLCVYEGGGASTFMETSMSD